jgi:hypothetical protein
VAVAGAVTLDVRHRTKTFRREPEDLVTDPRPNPPYHGVHDLARPREQDSTQDRTQDRTPGGKLDGKLDSRPDGHRDSRDQEPDDGDGGLSTIIVGVVIGVVVVAVVIAVMFLMALSGSDDGSSADGAGATEIILPERSTLP